MITSSSSQTLTNCHCLHSAHRLLCLRTKLKNRRHHGPCHITVRSSLITCCCGVIQRFATHLDIKTSRKHPLRFTLNMASSKPTECKQLSVTSMSRPLHFLSAVATDAFFTATNVVLSFKLHVMSLLKHVVEACRR